MNLTWSDIGAFTETKELFLKRRRKHLILSRLLPLFAIVVLAASEAADDWFGSRIGGGMSLAMMLAALAIAVGAIALRVSASRLQDRIRQATSDVNLSLR